MVTENRIMLIIFVHVFLTIASAENFDVDLETKTTECGLDGDCLSTSVNCSSKCGCDEAYYYNETIKQCVLNVKHLMKAEITIYDPVDPSAANDNSMAAHIRRYADKVFRGISVAVALFGACALVCVISACTYCCRINYTDRSLKGDVKALSKKLQRDHKIQKPAKVPRKAEAESCNVVVEDAGVFVC
ncbi:uncharacterized protein LOC106138742 isoform X2 [Amyelois transitella]|uniref:uncharacterized protein LOC106138742 isoform X2 n=1 Tax=Amyelois transitella TaxID=680683 RepID=UPI00067CA99B|nr:uncharacterized protein LOC106138742 isoform X2 [Amyelois transitella]